METIERVTCISCAHCFLDQGNKRFIWCQDLEAWRPRDQACQLYISGEKTLDQVFGKPQLGLQAEAGLE